MCGIAGYIASQLADQTPLKKMTDAIIHRGPDGEGQYYAPDFALGHRRLAIVDLSEAAAQPMHYLDRYVITYNGEVYNHPELREELTRRGYTFNSESDTEVILASYDCWGVDCLNKFNGMWAFVLYDKQEQQYFIARDRFGKKPLYYTHTTDHFVFCSEVKGIYASGLVEKAPNISYLKNYLENGPNEYEAETAFANIYRFPFAHYFLGSKEQLLKKPKFNRYWELKYNTDRESFCMDKAKKYAKEYYELLSDAVRIRMRDKVKTAAALSGGLDSSSIVYIMDQELKKQNITKPLQTYSSVHKTPGTEYCDESQYSEQVIKQLNIVGNEVVADISNAPYMHEKSIYFTETLFESIGILNYAIADQQKKDNIKVVLNGQGADETLAGYSTYVFSYLIDLTFIDFIKNININKNMLSKKQYIASCFIQISNLILGRKLTKKIFLLVIGREYPKSLNEELNKSIKTGLVNLLHYADHVPMGLGVEARTPFMDYRLIEFLMQIPSAYKIHKGWTKYIARLAFDKKLPDEVTWREDKMGWPQPVEFWLNNQLAEWVKQFEIKDLDKKDYITIFREININLHKKIFFDKVN